MYCIYLPCFEGFNQFAIWPMTMQQSVSKTIIQQIFKNIPFLIFKIDQDNFLSDCFFTLNNHGLICRLGIVSALSSKLQSLCAQSCYEFDLFNLLIWKFVNEFSYFDLYTYNIYCTKFLLANIIYECLLIEFS